LIHGILLNTNVCDVRFSEFTAVVNLAEARRNEPLLFLFESLGSTDLSIGCLQRPWLWCALRWTWNRAALVEEVAIRLVWSSRVCAIGWVHGEQRI